MKAMIFLSSFLLLSLSSCSKDDPKDLKQYLLELKQKPVSVENLVEVKPYEPPYEVYKSRNPFVPFDSNTEIKRKVITELESYPLKVLTMVGTLSDSDTIWALVRAPTGAVYQTKVGQKIGVLGGRVVKIEDNAIEVEEPIVDKKEHSSIRKEILPLQMTNNQENLK